MILQGSLGTIKYRWLNIAVFKWQDDETKPPLVKKEEPDATEPKQEPMETEQKKPELKTEPKEEESGANGSSNTSATQNRKKSKKLWYLINQVIV